MSHEKVLLLKCKECHAAFFTEGESNFYKKKGLHTPKRCKSCREKRKFQLEQRRQKQELNRVLANLQFEQVEEVEMQSADPNTILYIIGNGFDLMHGVPSSYYHFRDSLGRRNELRKTLEMYIQKEDLWADFEESLAYFDDEALLVTLNDWMDIFDVKEQHDDDFSAADFFMASEAAMSPTYTIMDELPKNFRKWIVTLKPTISNTPLKQIINTEARYINFNYTEFLETIYKVPKGNILYIHGDRRDTNKELILGHSDMANHELDLNPSDFKSDRLRMKNQTTYDLHATAGYQLGNYYSSTAKKSSDVIKANKATFLAFADIDTVVVIGHSLSVVDYPYFKEIIRKNKKSSNMKWLISWYSVGDIKRIDAFAKNLGIQSKQIKLFKT
ncbi:AbiH family protein [Ureibacillus thermosphaericus]|uniref:Probable zinc-binding domain-containing protein n=1 Tax=Ureibacillus thermosphaericus TaxID=51173 RepID=A0A840PRI5_URETH|nr:AbiH family protein [Ureibacillus thermosphaericus]MBB5149099.1 hypothetical protein [Ureibacillus thermosphaericus]NKZ31863.1 hypothetical protein [Ureibacillus thermosphaericus]